MNPSTFDHAFENDSTDDAATDVRLGELFHATQEPIISADLAQRAMRLAAAPRTVTPPATQRWAYVLNMIAALAIAAVIVLGAWGLWPLLNDSSSGDTATDTSSTSLSTQSSSTSEYEIAIGIAIVLAATGAQIVFRSPSEFPSLSIGQSRLA